MRATLLQPSEPLAVPAADYDHVRRALAFMTAEWRTQPSLDRVAAHLGITDTHLNHVFRRWAGITPKAFLQALTLDHARALLRANASLLDTALDVGLSGPGRLHDLFVTHEAMSPGEWKAKGEGLTLSYGFHPSPFVGRRRRRVLPRARRPAPPRRQRGPPYRPCGRRRRR